MMMMAVMPLLGVRRHHRHFDLLRRQQRDERPVLGVAEDELERVPSRRQIEGGLGLAAAEMKMVLVGRYDLGVRNRLLDIDKKVVMPGIRRGAFGLRDPHAFQPELNHKG